MSEELTELERDTLAEVGNISLGSAATALSNMLGKAVRITTPRLEVVTPEEMKSNYPVPCLVLQIRYLTGLEGENILVIRESDAKVIAALMMGMSPEDLSEELGEVEISAVGEAMNQMMGYASTSMAEMFNRAIDISPPHIEKKNLGEEETSVVTLEEEIELVQISFRIEVEEMLDSTLLQVIPLPFGKEMVKFLLPQDETAATGTAVEETASEEEETGASGEREELRGEGAQETEESSTVEEEELQQQPQPQPEPEPGTGAEPAGEEEAQKILWSSEAEPVDPETPMEERIRQLEMVKDVPVEVEVVLGRSRVPLKELFTLGRGGILELDSYSGEPVEIYVNDMMVGRGEVVVVNGQLGVRILSIESNLKRSGTDL